MKEHIHEKEPSLEEMNKPAEKQELNGRNGCWWQSELKEAS